MVSFNLFAYLSRSDVTWNPSIVSVCKASLYCPTTEEYILPVIHGNDRVEWFVQLSDEIQWEVEDRETGAVRARVTMKAGDVAAMPADIRHRGFSPKRSMLLVWENASPELPAALRQRQDAAHARAVLVTSTAGTTSPWPRAVDACGSPAASCRDGVRRGTSCRSAHRGGGLSAAARARAQGRAPDQDRVREPADGPAGRVRRGRQLRDRRRAQGASARA